MEVCINNLQTNIVVEESLENLLQRAVERVLLEQGVNREGEISIAFVDNAYIQQLNREYRQKDKPTDVLSFPMDDVQSEGDYLLLGDVIISLEKATEQALAYGHSLAREVAFLTIHGVLHLLGHDHEEEEERKWMENEQEKMLELLAIRREC